MFINEIKESITSLKGVGAKSAGLFSKMGVETVGDLLSHFPFRYEDRQTQKPLQEAYRDESINTVAVVTGFDYFYWRQKKALKIYIEDDTAQAVLLCYGRNYLASQMAVGSRHFISGTFQFRYGELQSSSFVFEPYSIAPEQFGIILPIYSTVKELSQNVIRRAVREALDLYGANIESELPPYIQTKYTLLSQRRAIKGVHFPKNSKEAIQSKKMLIYQELFHLQLTINRQPLKQEEKTRESKELKTTLFENVVASLPFSLTADQITSLKEIKSDMEEPLPMNRLLQGDVGSGKTLIAFLSSLPSIEAGEQVAFMAPTELLAKQHGNNAVRFLAPFGIKIALLTGAVKGKSRAQLLEKLKSDEVDMVIGTHALFTEDVSFRNLGYVIIDEQHRFGVKQRLSLMEKGECIDLLTMTATPIPRTMAMTLFNNLAISTIKTMPTGRKPIKTHLAKHGNEEKVYSFVDNELKKGSQAYFIYPLIEESEILQLKSAEKMVTCLSQRFPQYRVALIHSRVPDDEKEAIMGDFNNGTVNLLVATSVVEVGVDVPNATVIVIEHAERFGLPGLHQLRGRVGRGDKQSYAFLVYAENLTEEGKERLMIMKKEHDGFKISEKDLRLRGPGSVAGVEQSGFFKLKIADILIDQEVHTLVRDDVTALLAEDPGLVKPENRVLRDLFNRCPPFREIFLTSG